MTYEPAASFSTRFTELVGMPPSAYCHQAAGATAGMPPCVAKQVTRPIRNRAPYHHRDDGEAHFRQHQSGHHLDGTLERVQAGDAEVVQEPTDQPYGIRDCAVRDPAGNPIRTEELN